MRESEPYDPMCKRYAKDMQELDYSWAESQVEIDEATRLGLLPQKRIVFVLKEEGTYNSSNGHFLCNSCYIKAGMPSSPYGWTCP